MAQWLPLLFLIVLPRLVQAQLVYTLNDNSITITGYAGPSGNVVIPNTINGYYVTSIGDYAFLENTSLTSVTIPNSVTNIGDESFCSCTSLTNAILPDSIISIGEFAFAGCSSLTNFMIPDSVTSIGTNAFEECSSLTSITIPNGVTSIDDSAFASCTSLTNVILPDSIINIEEFAFAGASLTNLTLPDSVTCIGQGAFQGCNSLSTIIIPDSVTNIEVDAFLDCTSMTSISVDVDNQDYSSLNGILFDKAQDALLECPSALTNTDYTIPEGVVTNAENAFWYCPNLAKITIPGSLTNIVGTPFYDCTGLTNICVNSTNPAYSSLNGVLFDKAQDTLLQYPPGLTNASYTIPNSVTDLQDYAFSDCINLVNITIPNSVTNMGYGAFLGCTSLASVVIPKGVTSIPEQTFSECISLADVIIPYSVTNIGELAFSQCISLTSVTIPASAATIGDFAFESLPALASVYFEGNALPNIGRVFYDDPGTIVYYLPGATGWAATYDDVTTELWNPQAQNASVTAGQFGFSITGPTNATVVIQACTNLANPVWIPVSTNTFDSNGASSFSDAQWANHPSRFYRFSSW
ncbi:MAG TPA: leucine-rich repeat domain-containing protein [Candidatus Sulfotelmatobacter sp.]|nr:leucine-rich repeat domain-containing protein [Candidatus Sulfotelmatobacter sp.]